MKGALITVCCLLMAVGIFAGMVIYTISVLRQFERQILTGEISACVQISNEVISIESVPFGADFSFIDGITCKNFHIPG